MRQGLFRIPLPGRHAILNSLVLMKKTDCIRIRELSSLLSVAVLFLLCGPSAGLRAEDILTELRSRQEAVRSVSAEFVQDKHTRLMKKPLRSSGKFFFKRPDRVRWEYGGDTRLQVIFGGQDIWLYYPDLGEADHLSGAAQYSSLLQFDVASLAARYSVSGARHKEGYRVSLVTKGSGPVARMEMELDGSSGFPKVVKLFDSREDVTVITFRSVKVNPELRDEIFRFSPGPDVKVREQAGR